MRIMPINAPGGEHPLGVSILAWAAHVIHHLIVAAFLQCAADTAGDVRERLLPRNPHPSSFAPFSSPLQGVENPVRIRHLVQRRRTFGAVPAPRPRMLGVALEFADQAGFFIDVREQPTG